LGGYLVLEWLDGQSLEEVIETYANKTIEEKVQLFHRVTNALIPLSNWLVHRDLHPSNIMVLDNSFEYKDLSTKPFNTGIKVVDFGESYSSYVTTVSDLEIEDLIKLQTSNMRRLTTSLYATPPEYLRHYRENQNHIFDKSWNYDSWALGLIGFKIFLMKMYSNLKILRIMYMKYIEIIFKWILAIKLQVNSMIYNIDNPKY
jgi:serine/threonine protein kinase